MRILGVLISLLCGKLIYCQFDIDEGDDRSVVNYQFSFLLPGGGRSCFYQFIYAGSILKFSFKVLTAPTSMSSSAINLQIRSPNRIPIATYGITDEVETPDISINEEGDYEFCFGNYRSKFLEKKIQVFIGIINPNIFLEPEAVNDKNETIEVYHNMTSQVVNIISSLFHVNHFMWFSRRLENVDLANLMDNLQFINRCSMLMIILVILVAFMQTYALKRLFRGRLIPTSAPRA